MEFSGRKVYLTVLNVMDAPFSMQHSHFSCVFIAMQAREISLVVWEA